MNFIALGVWGDRAKEDQDLSGYLAMEAEFQAVVEARGWRRPGRPTPADAGEIFRASGGCDHETPRRGDPTPHATAPIRDQLANGARHQPVTVAGRPNTWRADQRQLGGGGTLTGSSQAGGGRDP